MQELYVPNYILRIAIDYFASCASSYHQKARIEIIKPPKAMVGDSLLMFYDRDDIEDFSLLLSELRYGRYRRFEDWVLILNLSTGIG